MGELLDLVVDNYDTQAIRSLPLRIRSAKAEQLLDYVAWTFRPERFPAPHEVSYALRVAAELGEGKGDIRSRVLDLARSYNRTIAGTDRGAMIDELLVVHGTTLQRVQIQSPGGL